MDVSDIESTLSVLERRVSALGTHREPPKTLLRVIQASQKEQAWHLLLAYFIDQTEPHQFGTAALERFLTAISDHPQTSFNFRPHELDSVCVDVEITADDGRPDLLIWVPDSWFICIEIKVSASETNRQTERYIASAALGEIDVASVPAGQRHYVYIADRRAAQSQASEFVDIGWKTVIESLDTLRTDELATYPARSGAQLSEFIDHIKHELHMTDDTASYTQKAELALEHRELLAELDNAVERAVEDMQASWDSDFLADPPEGWTTDWKTVRYGSNYGRLLKTDWLHSSNTTGKPNKGSGFAIAFPTELLQTNVENGQTFFKFKVYGGNEYSERYQDRFYADEFQERIAPIINKYEMTIEEPGDSSRLLKTPYSFEFDGGSGYQQALKRAFQEHLELVPHLEELYFDIRADIGDNEEIA